MKNKTLNGKRITFRVDEKTREQGERFANRRGTTISELAREGFIFIINIKKYAKTKEN